MRRGRWWAVCDGLGFAIEIRIVVATLPSLKEIAGRAAVAAERTAIRSALATTRGNKSRAARLLQVDYKTLHIKMKQYQIEAAEFRIR
jgi:DNA-binding NtrC family response regulator